MDKRDVVIEYKNKMGRWVTSSHFLFLQNKIYPNRNISPIIGNSDFHKTNGTLSEKDKKSVYRYLNFPGAWKPP